MTWKPNDYIDEEVRDWMKGKGWEVTATDYHFDQEIYSWRHQLLGGKLIFSNESGGLLEAQNVSGRHFKPLLRSASLPNLSLYGLRHSHATLLLAAGEHPKVVQERLGHSSIRLTLDTYTPR